MARSLSQALAVAVSLCQPCSQAHVATTETRCLPLGQELCVNDDLSQANSRGIELGKRHAALAEVIGQAEHWARSFGVVTSEVLPDMKGLVTRPLTRHADHLMSLWECLGRACVDLASSFEERLSAGPMSVTLPRREGAVEIAMCHSGAAHVHRLQSSSAYCRTLQDLWRDEVATASLYLTVTGVRTDDLERYAIVSQAIFNDASAVARDAYAHAVAATYGPVWARASGDNEGRALIAWMRALVEVGFTFEECASELRDVGLASPEAVAHCLARRSAWL